MFHVGQEVPVYVLKVDNEAKKIALSVRRAQPERWEEIVSGYREGQIVPGQVTKLAPFGAFVRLEGPIEGLIHISELVDRRIAHPKEVVEEGDVVPVKIVRIEYDRHRLGLSLKQAREKAEDDGWAFNATGGTLKVPQDDLERLGLTEMPVRKVSEPEASAEAAIAAEPESAAAAEATAEPEIAAEAALPEVAAEPAAAPEPEPAEAAPATAMEVAMQAAEAMESEEAAPAAAEEPEARDALPQEESIVEAADGVALTAGEVSTNEGENTVTEEASAAFNNSGES
jgi:predicted RNA-binding protein with RPS1 domain